MDAESGAEWPTPGGCPWGSRTLEGGGVGWETVWRGQPGRSEFEEQLASWLHGSEALRRKPTRTRWFEVNTTGGWSTQQEAGLSHGGKVQDTEACGPAVESEVSRERSQSRHSINIGSIA